MKYRQKAKALLLGMLIIGAKSAVAIELAPVTIAQSASDMPVLMVPPVKVGNSLYTGWGNNAGQNGIIIPLPAQESTYTKIPAAFQSWNETANSNFVWANSRLYIADSGSDGDPDNWIPARQSYVSFISFNQDGAPVTIVNRRGLELFDRNDTIGTVVLKDKYFRPTGALAADASGNLYLADRGNTSGATGSGVIWKITPVAGGNNHTTTVFHNSNGQSIAEGNASSALLIHGDYLYGLNSAGGANNKGTVFRKKLDGTGNLEVLHTFNTEGAPDGDLKSRSSLLVEGEWLYGSVTDWANSAVHGSVFRIKIDGSDFSLLHSFTGKGVGGSAHDGSKPAGPLALKDGWIYGTTLSGGQNNTGAIYRIDSSSGDYEYVGSFGASQIKPSGLLYDAETDAFYGVTQGGNTTGTGTTVFMLEEEQAFEIALSATRTDVELGKQDLLLNWSVQAAPADVICTSTSSPVNSDWDNSLLALEDDSGKKKGSGVTLDLAGVNSRMLDQANIFTLACTRASDTSISKTASVMVNAREPNPLSVSFNVSPNSTGEKTNLFWGVTAPGNAGGECRGTSEPAGYWSGTYAFGTNIHQLDIPTANGRTGKQSYTFTLVCERNEKDLRNPDNNSVTKTVSLEFDFGPGSGGTSSTASSASTSSAFSSSTSSTAAVNSSAASSVASGPQGSGGGGAINLWWMLSLCLLLLGRRAKS